MPMFIGMVMPDRKNKISRLVSKPLISKQQISQPQVIRPQIATSNVKITPMNKINLHNMSLGSNYSMNSLYNSPYRLRG